MKRELKNALKPEKSFEEWAVINGIEIQEMPITKKQHFLGWVRQRRVIAGLSMAMAACLILFAIILPIALSDSSNPDTSPKTYTAQDVDYKRIYNIEELYLVEDILLFDINSIMEYKIINKDIAMDNKNLILGYKIQECLLASSDKANGFYVDYVIRLYKHYEFVGNLNYFDLSYNFLINGVAIHYKIAEISEEKIAHVSFAYNNVEYFLEVKGFPNVTDITEDTLKILLNDLLT